MVLKLIIDVTVTIVRAFEIHRLTGASVGFGKILLSATYNLYGLNLPFNVQPYHKRYPNDNIQYRQSRCFRTHLPSHKSSASN